MRHTVYARARVRGEGAKRVALRTKSAGKKAEKRDTEKTKKPDPKKAKKSAAKAQLPKARPAKKKKAAVKKVAPAKKKVGEKSAGKVERNAEKVERNAEKAEQKTGEAEQRTTREKKERAFRFVRNAKQNAFLNALAKTGTVKGAAQLSGESRANHYRWMEDDAYRVGVSRARRMAADLLEDEAWRRGVEGDERAVYNKRGIRVDTVRYYSDRLLEKLLAANLPEKYKERVEQTVVGDGAAEFCWEGDETDGDEGRGEEDHNSLPAGKALAGEDSPRA